MSDQSNVSIRRRLFETKPPAIKLCGVTLLPDVTGALYWPEEDTLIVSDLHFEKNPAFAKRGVNLPPHDTSSTLTVLEGLFRFYRPWRVVVLGDSFQDEDASLRLSAGETTRLKALTLNSEWVWVSGKNDPEPPKDFGGEAAENFSIGSLVLRHEPGAPGTIGEIAGYLHPAARVMSRGRHIRRKCFLSDKDRIVLPALGAFTGGRNVLSEPFTELFPKKRFHAWILGNDTVYPVAATRLLLDEAPPRDVSDAIAPEPQADT